MANRPARTQAGITPQCPIAQQPLLYTWIKAQLSILCYGLLAGLAVGLALVSQNFVRPADCRALCDAPENAPCPTGACRAYEQRAGLPLPYLIDDPGGGSPTSGWGILGPEDLPNPLTFLMDVFFYGLVLGLVGYVFQVRRGKITLEGLAIWVALGLILALIAGGYLLYRPVLGR